MARVWQVSVHPFAQSLRSPLLTARGAIEQRSGFWFRIFFEMGPGELASGEDLTGLGEAMPFPAAGTEDSVACERALRQAIWILTGRDLPETVEALEALLDDTLQLGAMPAARHAVEVALMDGWGKCRGQPLSWLLSPDAQAWTPLSALLSEDLPERLAAEAKSLHGMGFRTLKLKVGALSKEEDLARVAAVTSATPDDTALRLDANRAWTLPEAFDRLEALDRASLGRATLCEDPLRSLDPAAWSELRLKQSVPIALDEPLASPSLRARFFYCPDAFDVWVLKPLVQGGLSRCWKMARAITGMGRRVVVTSSMDGTVARAAAAHLSAAIPGALDAGLYTGRLFDREAMSEPFALESAVLDLAGCSGHGVAWPWRPTEPAESVDQPFDAA